MIGKCGVYGAGAWGTALSLALNRMGHKVTLFCHRQETCDYIQSTRENPKLKEFLIPSEINITSKIEDIKDCNLVFLATPVHATSDSVRHLSSILPTHVPLILCSKGIPRINSEGQVELLDTVMTRYIPNPLFVLSGPNFAREVALGLPTASTLAHPDIQRLEDVLKCFHLPHLRVYGSTDTVGVQIAGALKNVYSIALGMARGKNLGKNAEAALLTRSLTEMQRIGVALGASPETFQGLSGLGDLVLSGTNLELRNMRFGYQIAQRTPLQNALEEIGTVEGYHTTATAYSLTHSLSIDTPILSAVHSVLWENHDLETVIKRVIHDQQRVWE